MWCPVCATPERLPVPLGTVHVLCECTGIQETRDQLGITEFLNVCKRAGKGKSWAYRAYVTGLDAQGVRVGREEYMGRGEALVEIREVWLGKW